MKLQYELTRCFPCSILPFAAALYNLYNNAANITGLQTFLPNNTQNAVNTQHTERGQHNTESAVHTQHTERGQHTTHRGR